MRSVFMVMNPAGWLGVGTLRMPTLTNLPIRQRRGSS